MQTRKLYYEDCHLQDFSATVVSCAQTAKGWQVVLDATAFYPEGGGQACDLGTLDSARVLDVQEQGETVVHLCDTPLTPGQAVTGHIDWVRRFDLMQQHSGEHILSGLIHERFGYHNVGFHIGAEVMEVDFDGPISPEALEELEHKANEAIWQNIPIRCGYPNREALPTIPYRSKKALEYPVRIVEVPGFDTCACCGVHVSHTGQIGLIKVLSCAKFHQGVRLQMVCGQRAYAYLSRVYEQNRQVSQIFSAKALETGSAAQRFSQQLFDEKFRATGLQKRLFDSIAAGFAGKGDTVHFEEDLSSSQLRELTDKIASVCGGTAAVFSGTDQAGYSLCMIGPQAKELGTGLAQTLGARGGGKPDSFQGSVRASRTQIEMFFKK